MFLIDFFGCCCRLTNLRLVKSFNIHTGANIAFTPLIPNIKSESKTFIHLNVAETKATQKTMVIIGVFGLLVTRQTGGH